MSVERAIISEIMSSSGVFEPLLRNGSDQAGHVTSMKVAMERAARYVALTQERKLDPVHDDLEKVLQDTPEYLAQMVMGLVVILGQYARSRGRSFIPIIEAAGENWGDLEPPLSIWR